MISPNQEDLSYSPRASFTGSRNWVSCQTQPLWLNNAGQCRRPPSCSSIAAAWTHEGTYLIYGFLASISFTPRNPSWIWIRYIQYATTGTTLCHPKIGYVDAMPLFHSQHLASRYIQYTTTGTTLCHPQNWLCRCDAFIPLSASSSQFTFEATLIETNSQYIYIYIYI